MKTPICYGAAALLMLSAPAAAQDKTQDPDTLTLQARRPPLTLKQTQRAVIMDALATENTQQKAPPNFTPEPGGALPSSMTVDAMPARALARDPSLQPFGYAKTAQDVLVIDPMTRTIVAVLPRADAVGGKDVTPAEWADRKGRELTGQAPQDPPASAQPQEPAGDSGDKNNGNEQKAE